MEMANDEDDEKRWKDYRALSRLQFIHNSIHGLRTDKRGSIPVSNTDYAGMDAMLQVIKNEALDVNYSIASDAPLRKHSPNLVGYTALNFVHEMRYSGYLLGLNDNVSSPSNIGLADINGSTPLHHIIEKMLENGGDIHDGDFGGWEENLDLVLRHYDFNVTANPSNKWGISHFHIACMLDHFQVVNFFLDSGVNVNETVKKTSLFLAEFTALHIAVRFSALATVRILLGFGASLHKRDALGRTPLELSILYHRKLIQSLRYTEYYSRRNTEIERMKKIVLILIQAHIDECPRHTLYQFHLACATGLSEVQNKFLKSAVNVNNTKTLRYSALHYAAQFNGKVMRYLLVNGGDFLVPDEDGITSLDICITKYKARFFQIFSKPLKRSIRFKDARAWDFLSILHNPVKLVRYLESNGAQDINSWRVTLDSHIWQGYSVLHIAVVMAQEGKISLTHNLSREIDLLNTYSYYIHNDDLVSLVSTVNTLMIHGADFTMQDVKGMSPLHLAFHLSKSNVVNSILKSGPYVVNPIDETGLSHFHISCLQGDLEATRSYLQNGISSNDSIACDCRSLEKVNGEHIVYREGSTPLHIAVAQKSVELIEVLVSHGADPFAKDADGLTPIHLAFIQMKEPFHQDSQKIMDLLFLSPGTRCENSILDSSGLSHFHAACVTSDYSIVEDLLANDAGCHELIKSPVDEKEKFSNIGKRADEKFPYWSPLYVTVSLGNWTTSDVLLRHGADSGIHTILSNGKSCLHAALMQLPERYHEVRSFVSKLSLNWNEMVPLDEYGLTPLHIAAALHHRYSIKTLTISESSVNARISPKSSAWSGYTALHMAVQYYISDESDNCDDIVRILLSYGIDVAIPNSKNETALHMAFKRGLTKVVSLILDHNSLTLSNLIDDLGLTHLHIVCSMNYPQLVTRFLDSGVDVNETTEFFADIPITDGRDIVIGGGFTPLHFAALFCVEEVVDVLLRHGADANSRDCKGWTPLHEACAGVTNNSIIEKLLRVGHADPTMMNVMHQTVFHVMMKFGRVDIDLVKILLEYPTSVHSASNEYGDVSAFDYCVRLANFEISELVIEAGLHLNETDNRYRWNALHSLFSGVPGSLLASMQPSNSGYNREEYMTLIDLLIEKGCDLDGQDTEGRTPLYFAVEGHNVEGVVAILLSGADINVIESEYGTRSALQRIISDYDDHNNMEVKTIIMIHIKTLESASFYLCPIIRDEYESELRNFAGNDFGFNDDMTLRLQEEKEKMKNVFVSNGWTLYDILMGKENEIALIINKVVLKEIMAPNYILNEFPELGCLLKLQYKRGLARRKLLDSSVESVRVSVGVRLPELCWENIIKYMSNEDLARFSNIS